MTPHASRQTRTDAARRCRTARGPAHAWAYALAAATWLGVPLPLVLAGHRQPQAAASEPGAPAPPRAAELPECVVVLYSGRTVRGLLVRRDREAVVVRVDGIDTPIPARSVEAVRVLPSARERYLEMRAAIEPGDTSSMLLLAQWLRDRELYEEALAEVARVVELEPFNTAAGELKRWLDAQLVLERRRAPSAAALGPSDDAPDDPAIRPPARSSDDEFPLLTDEQINLIRVYEIDLSDPPRVRIDRETAAEFVRAYASSSLMPQTPAGRERLLSGPSIDVLELMFRLQAREFYGRVAALENPRAITLFKRSVQGSAGWLTNACATARCHGGSEAGRLRLAVRRPNSDATAFTNLLILDRFTLPDGTPLIDYAQPDRSPLLHMGLIRELSLFPHPEVPGRGGPGWRPVFRSTDDRGFVRATEWIRAMYTPRIGYPVEYEPPGPAAAPPDPAAPEPVNG